MSATSVECLPTAVGAGYIAPDDIASAPILIVDDDEAVGLSLQDWLRQDGHAATWVSSAALALEALRDSYVALVLTDLRMPVMDGMALLGEIKRDWPDVSVVMISGFGTVPLAVEAMQAGAFDFIQKPPNREELRQVVRKELLRTGALHRSTSPAVPGTRGSAAMAECQKLIAKAARAELSTVLLLGENGVGKEVAAHAIHNGSNRARKPFIVAQVNSLPKDLLENELFGHEKDAFHGATCRKPGRVELAEGGTLFLDEIGDVPMELQGKLLRLLQERQFERLGIGPTMNADVRFIAATNKNLKQMVAEGTFREDLYHRLFIIPILIPALRERREDIRPLALQFLEEHSTRNRRPEMRLSDDALALLEQQPWPGNVRELQNFVERLVVMADDSGIDAAFVQQELSRSLVTAPAQRSPGHAGAPTTGLPVAPQTKVEIFVEVERQMILDALKATRGNVQAAANALGMGRRTIYNRMKELGIDPKLSRGR